MKDNPQTGSSFHLPVLAEEVVDILTVKQDAVIYDGTLGGGGHAERILENLSDRARYIAVDRDPEALDFARTRLQRFDNIVFYNGVFNDFEGALKKAGVDYVDGVFLDLGVSSHQIDENRRGFAFRKGVKLDMRMSREDQKTAVNVLNEYSAAELTRIFREYGEERFAGKIARRIVREREPQPITHADRLMDIIRRSVGSKFLVKSYARIFQALRIEVNRELELLHDALAQGLEILAGQGRLAVITYHSLEDRIVKQFIRSQEDPCICPPELPECVCGRKPRMKRWKPVLITPGPGEIADNPRARSAKLRVGEKI